MYYGSGTDVTRTRRTSGQPADATAYATASGRENWTDAMATILNARRHTEIGLRQSTLGRNPAKFHPHPIWNGGAWGLFSMRTTTRKTNKNEQGYGISSWSKNTHVCACLTVWHGVILCIMVNVITYYRPTLNRDRMDFIIYETFHYKFKCLHIQFIVLLIIIIFLLLPVWWIKMNIYAVD